MSRAAFAQDLFHFDLDDWRALKFFFYLTDVGIDDGPHVYVRGSHRSRPLGDQFIPFKGRSAQFIAARHTPASVTTVTGLAGTGFVEDPYGYHTGRSVKSRARLMLDIEYGVSPIPLVDPFRRRS
jgi:hypothetical protein